MPARLWTREELLPVLEMYFRTPFGKLHHRNPEIIAIAEGINRSPSAVAMKACNLASCDQQLQKRNIQGLSNASELDRSVFEEFLANPERLIKELRPPNTYGDDSQSPSAHIHDHFPVGRDCATTSKRRIGHAFFRKAVFTNFGGRCSISGLSVSSLLTASHIIPWKEDRRMRCDPRNGLLLSALHDRAFDRGFLSLTDDYEILISPNMRMLQGDSFLSSVLLGYENRKLKFPKCPKFLPSQEALAFHREHIFKG